MNNQTPQQPDDTTTQRSLEALGYDGFFDLQWTASGFKDFLAARVIAEHKEAYTVITAHGEFLAKITGKQMFHATQRADYPAVGDWVAITMFDKDRAVIHHILPRKTILRKKYSNKQDTQIIATNIDIAFIVESLDRDFNLNRLERYLVLANEGGIKPVIVVNKTDLVSEAELQRRVEEIKNRFGRIDSIPTSIVTDSGLDKLIHYIGAGKTHCFLGSSGVGKSSLINKLLKSSNIKTREISDFTGRGKHTTTSREMYFLENGGIVIDNPGTREVGIADAGAGIEQVFNEIALLARDCKYADCRHIHEPGCAVVKAIEEGRLDQAHYQNYIKLKKENEFYEMTDSERRAKDKKFGKFIKKAKDQLKEFKP